MTTPLPFRYSRQWWDGTVQVEGKGAPITADQLPTITASKAVVRVSKGWFIFTYLCVIRLKKKL